MGLTTAQPPDVKTIGVPKRDVLQGVGHDDIARCKMETLHSFPHGQTSSWTSTGGGWCCRDHISVSSAVPCPDANRQSEGARHSTAMEQAVPEDRRRRQNGFLISELIYHSSRPGRYPFIQGLPERIAGEFTGAMTRDYHVRFK